MGKYSELALRRLAELLQGEGELRCREREGQENYTD
jgi:hypothetical protein